MSSQTGTVSSTTGTASWTNPNNIVSSNNVYAVSASITNGNLTGFLYALGHGFSIPSGATIDGVTVSVEGKNSAGNGFRISSGEMDLMHSGAQIGTNSSPTTNWTGTGDLTRTLGTSSYLWGATLNPAIVNDSSFGLRVRFTNLFASAQTFSVDHIYMTIYYTDAISGQSSQQLFMYEG